MAQLRGRIDNTDRLARTLREVVIRATEDPFRRTRRVLVSGGASASSDKISGQQIVAKDFRTALNVGDSEAGVVFDSSGIRGYNSSVQQTFDIGTDGSGFLGLGATQITWDTAGDVAIPGGAINAGTIGELQLADEAVTNAKIAVAAIQGDVIAAGAITETKIDDGSVSTAKLAAASVTAAKIAAGTITATEIASNAITSVKINAGAVTSDKINVGSLSAISANLGSVTAGTVTGATIRSASSGARVELNSGGIDIHGSSSTLLQFHSTPDGASEASILGVSAGLWFATNAALFTGEVSPAIVANGSVGSSGSQWPTSYIQTMRTNVITHITQSTGLQFHTSAGSNKIGFFGVTPVVRPSVTGSRGGNAALADLLTSLAALGLITDSTT